MGIIEKESKKRRQKANIQKIILGLIAAGGIMGVALVAPQALKAIDLFYGGRENRRKSWSQAVAHSKRRMVNAGLLKFENGFYRITEIGKRRLRYLELHDFKLKKPKKWDKKWRMLIFDIRESRKVLREKVRRTLRAIGFKHLQDSVWVYPYDCEDLVTLLKADFKIGKEILYLIVDTIENDKNLREEFGLSSSRNKVDNVFIKTLYK